MLPTATLELMRAHALRLMWDTCQLIPKTGTARSVSASGILQQTPAAARTYNASPNIPCRIDLARAFRPGELKYQTTVVDNYNLELPHDVTINESDTVVIGGEYYEIRKLKVASDKDVTREALIFTLGTDHDNY